MAYVKDKAYLEHENATMLGYGALLIIVNSLWREFGVEWLRDAYSEPIGVRGYNHSEFRFPDAILD